MCGVSLTVQNVLSIVGNGLSSQRCIDKAVLDARILCAQARRGPDGRSELSVRIRNFRIDLCATLLQLRGRERAQRSLLSNDTAVLAFNGEIYSGLSYESPEARDTIALFKELSEARVLSSKLNILSRLRGPWAFVYVDWKEEYILMGKDFTGRKSLLMHLPDVYDPRLLVCSTGTEFGTGLTNFWSELCRGIHRVDLKGSKLVVESMPLPIALSLRKNICINPPRKIISCKCRNCYVFASLLDRAVKQQVNLNQRHELYIPSSCKSASILVLFSGGLDSTTIAALAHRHTKIGEVIDLCSVCFQGGGSPDRIASLHALRELKAICPGRTWRLIEVDVRIDDALTQFQHVSSLLQPTTSIMDLNIGVALWFACKARGFATVHNPDGTEETVDDYTSHARVALLGQGADELLGGYRRHKIAFDCGGLTKLADELDSDMERIWIRNLGRDDRVVSDTSREARYPFLDEELGHAVSLFPLHHVVDFRFPLGVGDKMILRTTALHLGLQNTSKRVKCALQFGSKVHKFENVLKSKQQILQVNSYQARH